MLFREHRGALDESLKTTFEFTDKGELIAHISKLLWPYHIGINPTLVKIEFYCEDNRKNMEAWKATYLVTLQGYGVIGFTNGSPESDITSDEDLELYARMHHSEQFIMMFLGFLHASIPALRDTPPSDIIKTWDEFKISHGKAKR